MFLLGKKELDLKVGEMNMDYSLNIKKKENYSPIKDR